MNEIEKLLIDLKIQNTITPISSACVVTVVNGKSSVIIKAMQGDHQALCDGLLLASSQVEKTENPSC